MQRKRHHLIFPLISVSLLTGCAAQATDRYAPAPQALIEAAEQASQMRMVYADIQARANGYTVESVRLDARDANAPDFMRAKVRLDYNGPMKTVLSRVSNDIGYRLNEYSKPASGLSWSPWIRLSGNKSLLDHLREMNSQVPWHIVLDHRNQRLVVDYSDDGGMAQQVMRAQEKLNSNSGQQTRNLPSDGRATENRARRAVSKNLSNEPTLPHAEVGRTQPNAPAPSEVWYVAVEGYNSAENARSMVAWLSRMELSAHTYDAGAGLYDVRVIAKSSRDAMELKKLLKKNGVPSELGYEDDNQEMKERAEKAMTDGWPSNTAPARSRNTRSQARSMPAESKDTSGVDWQVQGGRTSSGISVLSSSEASRIKRDQWTVQLSHSRDSDALASAVSKVERAGHSAAIFPYSGSMRQLRAVGFQTRSDAARALASLKGIGFSDAYLLSPKGE